MTTTLAKKVLWGTVALTFLLFVFMFIYTGATWDTQALRNAGYAIIALLAIPVVPYVVYRIVRFGFRFEPGASGNGHGPWG